MSTELVVTSRGRALGVSAAPNEPGQSDSTVTNNDTGGKVTIPVVNFDPVPKKPSSDSTFIPPSSGGSTVTTFTAHMPVAVTRAA